jgi:biotin carboxyl carrier protein
MADRGALRVHVTPAPGVTGLPPNVVSPGDSTDPDAWELDGRPLQASLERRSQDRAVLHTSDGPTRVLFLPGPEPLGSGSTGRSGWPAGSRFEVVLNGWRLIVDVEPEARAALRDRARRGTREAGAARAVEVRAIIPGRVVTVAVASGDVVTAGQALIVVEAMKMQNELRAPRAGTVGRVAVAAGQTVDAGALVVVLE